LSKDEKLTAISGFSTGSPVEKPVETVENSCGIKMHQTK
jgi:hypothetical protein